MLTDPREQRRAAQTAGLCATLVGIALGRFAYPPLIPEMIAAGWLTPGEAASAGAANLVGYFAGAVLALFTPRSTRYPMVVTALIATLVSFVACAIPLGASWMNAWRFIAGIGGAWLMVRGVSAVLMAVPAPVRTHVSGRTFTGIGVGTLLTAAVATALPWIGPTTAWLLMAGIAGVGVVVGLRAWFAMGAGRVQPDDAARGPVRVSRWVLAPVLIIAAYAVEAIGIVPHAVFWVDFLVRERELSMGFAASQWWVVGIGSLVGPTLIVRLASRTGVGAALLGCYALTAVAVGTVVFTTNALVLTVSSLVIGALVPGAVSMTSAALAQIAGPHGHARWWAGATLAFAIGQAAGAAAMAARYNVTELYAPLFVAGASAAVVAVILAAAGLAWLRRYPSPAAATG